MDWPVCVATCVCGKKPKETKNLLPVAIRCFQAQTYPGEKRLLLVTETENADKIMHLRNGRDVHVLGVKASVVLARPWTLGELRNTALDYIAEQWHGGYAIQWDADDFHAYQRMAVQMIACKSDPGIASFLHCQLCYSFPKDVGFVRTLRYYGGSNPPEGTPTPLHGTICHPVNEIRYPTAPKGEDSVFFERWKAGYAEIDNSPELYVRFSHGESVTGDAGVMQDHLNDPPGTRAMSAGNAEYLAQVLGCYSTPPCTRQTP